MNTDYLFDANYFKEITRNKIVFVPESDRDEVTEWVKDNNVEVNFFGKMNGKDIWLIEDDDVRTMFLLRWS